MDSQQKFYDSFLKNSKEKGYSVFPGRKLTEQESSPAPSGCL